MPQRLRRGSRRQLGAAGGTDPDRHAPLRRRERLRAIEVADPRPAGRCRVAAALHRRPGDPRGGTAARCWNSRPQPTSAAQATRESGPRKPELTPAAAIEPVKTFAQMRLLESRHKARRIAPLILRQMILRPDLTVAAVVERDGQFLLVEERVGAPHGVQPAGRPRRSAASSSIDAVVRETLEETAWTFHPEALVGIYLWEQPEQAAQLPALRLLRPGERPRPVTRRWIAGSSARCG